MACRPVPHSLYDYDGAEICLIVKDKQGVPYAGPFQTYTTLLKVPACTRQALIGSLPRL